MSYVKSSLGADEEILMIARFPWPYHLVAWGSLLILGIVGVGIIIWAMMLVHFATTEAALTTRRVVYKKGLFTRETLELGVSTIEQIELHQGFWGRIFGFGVVEVSGTGEGQIRTHSMADPVKFRRLVTDARAQDRAIVVEQSEFDQADARTRARERLQMSSQAPRTASTLKAPSSLPSTRLNKTSIKSKIRSNS